MKDRITEWFLGLSPEAKGNVVLLGLAIIAAIIMYAI